MSTPVVTEKWAGQFDCDRCRRKRLLAAEFSKKALERYRKSGGGPLTCKQCVAQTEEAERNAAAKRRASDDVNNTSGSGEPSERRDCATCRQLLSSDAFNRNQWAKGSGKSRCRTCVEKALQKEAAQQKQSKHAAIETAKRNVERARVNGNAQEILKAESVLSALEAEQVTGLKPVKMSGRGRGRGGGRGRGRSSFGRGR